MEPQVLIEETGPNGNVAAFVEDDGRVVYLYLRGPDGAWMKSVWVQNRLPAPDEVDAARMQQGRPPLMPRAHCRHPEGAPALDPGQLRLVWLPEGNGVALTDDDGLLAAVVPWTGLRGFPGYARHALGEGPFAWQLAGADALLERFSTAEAYWADWDRSPNPWQRIQGAQLAAYEAAFGKPGRYFAIGGDSWPPRALVRFDRPAGIVLVTVGMALRPQPQVEMADARPEALRRVELGVSLPAETPEAVVEDWISYVAGQVDLPWARYTWLGHGHTIPCDAATGRGFPAVLLAHGEDVDLPSPLPAFAGDPVNVLWLTPVTADEWVRARRDGAQTVLPGLRAAHGSRA
jgi:hypothetical protein